jgi:uncharacterized protein (TIRG00374 family)
LNETTAPKNRSWVLQWIIGILFSAAAIFLLTRVVRWEEVKTAFASIRPLTFLAIVAAYMAGMLMRALCWQTLLQRRVSFGWAFLGLNEGYFLNNILPFRLGELGRAFLIGRRTGMGTLNTLSTVVVERAYDMAIAAGLLLSVLPFVLKMSWARPVAIIVLAIIVIALFALFLAARQRERLIAWAEKRFGQVGIIHRLALPWLNSLLEGFSVLTRFELFAISLGALLLSWAFALVRDYLVIHNLNGAAPFWWVMLAISASNLGGAVPSMMASLGTFEGAATGAMVLAGAEPELGLVYAIVIHVVHLVISSAIGAVALGMEGQSLTKLVTDLRSMR